ncbi:DUF1573 domain-containing protein [Flavobacterium sp. GT3R68]|uniref:DUF1573 domain-containing protein n=1 Tax=Flavobacterium sp. GT3R68 TaxID=2594437 RepID=UPI000F865589|nr:DUF1573 domain-containing protein [Flavobacterium sp. GT3R68]RTY95293.1 DUF1573 domain-containing protein [Flavobacterium sp. GSN2]TRW90966.1 DUF1573 domain-containing protein [Flavobacterium sp. GT3R68]
MIKKVVCLLVIASLVLTVSCQKKEQSKEEQDKIMNPTPQKMDSTENYEPTRKVAAVDGKYPVMTFDKTEHDFGMINSGDKVEYSFNFKNTGEADLIITRAVGSCGCTIPEYPKEAIKPGESAKMKVSFNSAGKHGQQQKTVTIITNTEKGTESLTIKASINEKK